VRCTAILQGRPTKMQTLISMLHSYNNDWHDAMQVCSGKV